MQDSGHAQEVVRRLLSAESRANERLAEAEALARARLEEAAAEARKRREQAATRATGEREETLVEARAAAEAEAAARLDDERARWQAMAAAAEGRVDDAADLVVAWVCADESRGEVP